MMVALSENRNRGAGGAETESAYYWYDAANGMTERRVYTPGSGWVDTYYYYDLNGGRTALVEGGEATYYAYGPHGFPTRIKPPNEAVTYFYYDGKLNRYCIDLAGTPTYFLWEGLNLLEERNADGSLKVRYTHGYTPIEGIGSIVEAERRTATATYFQYLHMDHRGTVYAVTDGAENVELSYAMDAFGRAMAATGGADPNVPNDLIYQANWLTLEIGGRRYGVSPSRIYDFGTGRFLQRDPLRNLNNMIAAGSGNVLGIYAGTALAPALFPIPAPQNIYNYTSGDVLTLVDPTGLFWKRDVARDDWVATRFGDSLMDLAKRITGNKADWVCIWPKWNWKKPNNYPVACPGDRADVSSILPTSGPKLYTRMIDDTRTRRWFNDYRYIPNPQMIAATIKKVSHEGATPIQIFYLYGHDGNSAGGGRVFTPRDLESISLKPRKGLVGYHRAKQKRGAYRCWFAVSAITRFIGCQSVRNANAFAKFALRRGATARGLAAWLDMPGALHAFFGGKLQVDPNWKRTGSLPKRYYGSVRGMLGDPAWRSKGGSM